MLTYARAEDDIANKLFPRVSSRGLYYRARDGHRGIFLFSFRNLCVHMPKTKFQRTTPHSKMAANKLFFCLHIN